MAVKKYTDLNKVLTDLVQLSDTETKTVVMSHNSLAQKLGFPSGGAYSYRRVLKELEAAEAIKLSKNERGRNLIKILMANISGIGNSTAADIESIETNAKEEIASETISVKQDEIGKKSSVQDISVKEEITIDSINMDELDEVLNDIYNGISKMGNSESLNIELEKKDKIIQDQKNEILQKNEIIKRLMDNIHRVESKARELGIIP